MSEDHAHRVREKLDRLRSELVELAFNLECSGRLDGADVAMIASARVEELCDEIVTREPVSVETL